MLIRRRDNTRPPGNDREKPPGSKPSGSSRSSGSSGSSRSSGSSGPTGSSGSSGPTGPAPQLSTTPPRWYWLLLIVAVAALIGTLALSGTNPPQSADITYSAFRTELARDNIAEVTAKGQALRGTFRKPVVVGDEDRTSVTAFRVERPEFAQDDLVAELAARKVTLRAEPDDGGSSWIPSLVINLLFIAAITLPLVFLMRRTQGGGVSMTNKSKRITPPADGSTGTRTTFADVAGIDEAIADLNEIVDMLRHPDRYRELGATIPKGVLLTGPPGTGKTLLARAVAGEADVPFFSMSASEFIELYVGVGASRVRALFDEAKKAAPAILFIDELDAIGRTRGGAFPFGGHEEREQTLNQILTEMDGFTGAEGVVVLAATNRPEILDPALLRAGRFDRHVTINPPDAAGRAAILRVHTRSVKLDPDVDVVNIAASTPGMVGADLRNLVNEAALCAARHGRVAVARADFADALERVLLGAERHIAVSPLERARTAYHEAGHALVGMLQPGADPVRKVSIIPRGRALGVTLQTPANDRYGYSLAELRGRLVGALGGRAAEMLVFGELTTGAESDLDMATRLARQMVGRWGMSEEVGPVAVLPDPRDEMVAFATGSSLSEETRRQVDDAVRRLIITALEDAQALLREHRDKLERLAQALLAHESLDEHEAYRVAGVGPPQPDGHAAAVILATPPEATVGVTAKPPPPVPHPPVPQPPLPQPPVPQPVVSNP